jgi:type II secretory pathway pseudopilin PulG
MKKTRRSAYTLLEIILVMAVLVVVMGVSIPVAQTMFLDARISASADVLRAQMAEARSRAMEDGRPWRVGFLPNTGIYQLAPEDAPCWSNPDKASVEGVELIRGELPKEIIIALSYGGIADQKETPSAGGTWETMGIYLAEGYAREDATVYFGKPGLAPMRLQLRGLTGVVNIQDSFTAKADQP